MYIAPGETSLCSSFCSCQTGEHKITSFFQILNNTSNIRMNCNQTKIRAESLKLKSITLESNFWYKVVNTSTSVQINCHFLHILYM